MSSIYYSHNNSWIDIDTKEIHEKGRVKPSWKCHLCMYNSGENRNIKMFKGVGNGRFKIFCHQCAEMGDMLDFLLGEGSNKRVVDFLRDGCKV